MKPITELIIIPSNPKEVKTVLKHLIQYIQNDIPD